MSKSLPAGAGFPARYYLHDLTSRLSGRMQEAPALFLSWLKAWEKHGPGFIHRRPGFRFPIFYLLSSSFRLPLSSFAA
ncbi:hypothetical protein HMPREF3039_00358 [Akkermansia sp. KLE1798]|nr:hypothetical protein HMPREF3039_00358 [Akkermansia sp. KLE1798]KZA03450.1 hypothetical protein HMPREF1326_02879 [Akkermansia sp. KLE1605]